MAEQILLISHMSKLPSVDGVFLWRLQLGEVGSIQDSTTAADVLVEGRPQGHIGVAVFLSRLDRGLAGTMSMLLTFQPNSGPL